MAKRKLTKPKEKDRKQIFIELVAQGKDPYPAALEAGYAQKTAQTKSGKVARKWIDKIEALKKKLAQIDKELGVDLK